jgi:Subtilase family
MARLIVDVPKLTNGNGQFIYNNANEHLQTSAQTLGVRHLTEFREHLGRMGVQNYGRAEHLPSTFHLVEADDDDVFGAVSRIIRFHNDRKGSDPMRGYVERVEVDHPLKLSSPGAEMKNFKLSGMHSTYMGAGYLDVDAAHANGEKGAGMRVAVVDSGVEPHTVGYSSYHDMLNTSSPPAAVDDGGHGTAMATIINAVAPDAEVHVVRVVEKTATSLWNTMAGVATAVYDCKAHIINMSLGFQHLNKMCKICGGTGYARSMVFENLLDSLAQLYRKDPTVPSPLYVAAAGNDNDPQVDYPAHYPVTLAVGAVNSKFERSSFSNYGANKSEYFVMPGGEEAAGAPTEWVGEGQDSAGATTYCLGTSPAAAYASGLLAIY